MRQYLKLLEFLKGHRYLFAAAVVAMFAASLFEGLQLTVLVPLVDRVFTGREIIVPAQLPDFVHDLVLWFNQQDRRFLLWAIIAVTVPAFLIKHTVIYVYQFLMNNVSQRVMRDVRQRLFDKIIRLSLDFFTQRRSGELIARITSDVNFIETAVSYGVTDLFRQTFLILFYLSVAFTIHPKAALVIFCSFPFLAYPITRIGKKLRKLAASTQERMADINAILIEAISGIRIIKAFCTEDWESKKFRHKNHDYYKLRMKSIKRTLLISPVTEMFGVVCGVVMIAWLGTQILEQRLSFGVFVLFFGSVMSLISPFKKLGNVNAITQQALAANERIHEILLTQPRVQEPPDPIVLGPFHKAIVMEDVHFRYNPNEEDVLCGIQLQIPKGALIAVVGPTGSGKSTLVSLIPRFYDPTAGRVLVDGVDLKRVRFDSWRRQIGIVTQETFLFNDTVFNNIAYGRNDISMAEVEKAARHAHAHDFIVRLPHGYKTVIGDRGVRLSGGEKQRIAIARAIVKNPRVLILDEATSHLDSESERLVQKALDHLMQGRTTIAVAHRLSTILKADQIVVLDKGRIVGRGRHEELLHQCPLYHQLFTTQFQVNPSLIG